MNIHARKSSKIVLGVLLSSAVTSCAIYTKPEEVRESATKTYEEARKIRRQLPDYKNIEVVNSMFVKQLTSEEAEKPNWYFVDKTIDYRNAPFALVVEQTFKDIPVNFKNLDGVDTKKLISLRAKGTMGEGLKAISDAAGYNYSLTGNTITFSKFQIKTFDIAMIPGIETFGVGKKGGKAAGSKDGSSKDSIITSRDEFSHATGIIDVYQDLRQTLPLLLSKEGAFELNPATTSLIVKDFPANVTKIEEYIYDQNEKMTRQVAIDMVIIDVQFDDTTRFGIDWGMVAQEMGSKDYTMDLGTAFLGSLPSSSVAPMILEAAVGKGRLSGTSLLVQALQAQGTVSTRSYPRTISLNNRVAKLRSVKSQKYISEQKITNTINIGSESAVKLDTIEAGFSMYALSKIYKNEVIMRLTTNISTLLKIEKKGSNSGDAGTQVLVESPNISDKDFDNSVIISNGSTLLIAGLSNIKETATDSSSGTEVAGFSKSSSKVKVETIIAITPRILRGVRG